MKKSLVTGGYQALLNKHWTEHEKKPCNWGLQSFAEQTLDRTQKSPVTGGYKALLNKHWTEHEKSPVIGGYKAVQTPDRT